MNHPVVMLPKDKDLWPGHQAFRKSSQPKLFYVGYASVDETRIKRGVFLTRKQIGALACAVLGWEQILEQLDDILGDVQFCDNTYKEAVSEGKGERIMKIFDVLEAKRNEQDVAQAKQDEFDQQEQDRLLRDWLLSRLAEDFVDYGDDFDLLEYLAPGDLGIGPIRFLYKGVILWSFDGDRVSIIQVHIEGRGDIRRGHLSKSEFWHCVYGLLEDEYQRHTQAVESRKKRFWIGVKYQQWGLANVASATIGISEAKKALEALKGQITNIETDKMIHELELAESKLEDLRDRCARRRHQSLVRVERLERENSRHEIWKRVRRERLSLALFYPFVYYKVYYGCGEDDYVCSRYDSPSVDEWYDDLVTGSITQVLAPLKIERVEMTNLCDVEYLSWCRVKIEDLGTLYYIYTVPDGLELESLSYVFPDDDNKVVAVNLSSGKLSDAGVDADPFSWVPLIGWHAPYSWLEQAENEWGLMSGIDSMADEQLGVFRPATLQEWLGIIIDRGNRQDLDEFLELCPFDESEAVLPPKIESWNG